MYEAGFESFHDQLDTILVFVSFGTVGVTTVFTTSGAISGKSTVLRALRLVRVVRFVKTLHYFKELVLVVKGMMGALRTTFWVTIMLFFILYYVVLSSSSCLPCDLM